MFNLLDFSNSHVVEISLDVNYSFPSFIKRKIFPIFEVFPKRLLFRLFFPLLERKVFFFKVFSDIFCRELKGRFLGWIWRSLFSLWFLFSNFIFFRAYNMIFLQKVFFLCFFFLPYLFLDNLLLKSSMNWIIIWTVSRSLNLFLFLNGFSSPFKALRILLCFIKTSSYFFKCSFWAFPLESK